MAVEPLPLLGGDLDRPLIWRNGRSIGAKTVLAHATALATDLPPAPHVINLCEDRGHFLTGFCAAILAGKTTLLPPSRASGVVREIAESYAPAFVLDDAMVDATMHHADIASRVAEIPRIEPSRVVAIGFTSGSTGIPKANAKTWGAFAGSTQRNRHAFEAHGDPAMTVVATVPSQHMYGMETCVLMPLLGGVAMAVDRPLFPQDLANALGRVPSPRLLVTTPVHLRAFVEAGIDYPSPALIVSATAPLSIDLAAAAEKAFRAPLLEVFGSTETCVIASRRTAVDRDWRLYPALHLAPSANGTVVDAPYFAAPVFLHDHLEMTGHDRFVVMGRCQDMLEIAGKRASLGDITARLLSIDGVDDAAVVQCDRPDAAGVKRIIAFVVGRSISDDAIMSALKHSLDPVFLPRQIRRLERLPRNETGKLVQKELQALICDK